jgi:heme-degrading monooxygenase HmoA
MIQIIWHFKVVAGREGGFEAQYGQSGGWVRLFEQASGYCGTVLLRGENGEYLTIDTWDSRESFQEFKATHEREYKVLDQQCERLTENERLIGVFEAI